MKFIFYCLCGGTGVLVDYGIYSAALTQGIWYQGANGLGYLGGTLVSFFLNRLVTFNVLDKAIKRMGVFLLVAGLGYTTSSTILWILIDFVMVDPKIAKIITLPVVVVLQFTLNRKITFKQA